MLQVQSALTQTAMGWSHVRYWLMWCDSREDTVLHLHGDHCAVIIPAKCDGDDLQYIGREADLDAHLLLEHERDGLCVEERGVTQAFGTVG